MQVSNNQVSFKARIDIKPKQMVRLAKRYGQSNLNIVKNALPKIKEQAGDDVTFSIRFRPFCNPYSRCTIYSTIGRLYIQAKTILPNGKKIKAKDYNYLSEGRNKPLDTAIYALKLMNDKKYDYWTRSTANPEISASVKEIEAIAKNKTVKLQASEEKTLAELSSLVKEFDEAGINGNEFVMSQINGGKTIADIRESLKGLKNTSLEDRFKELEKK